MNRDVQIMAWREETGKGDRKKGRGEHSCSPDDIQEGEERRGRKEGDPETPESSTSKADPH